MLQYLYFCSLRIGYKYILGTTDSSTSGSSLLKPLDYVMNQLAAPNKPIYILRPNDFGSFILIPFDARKRFSSFLQSLSSSVGVNWRNDCSFMLQLRYDRKFVYRIRTMFDSETKIISYSTVRQFDAFAIAKLSNAPTWTTSHPCDYFRDTPFDMMDESFLRFPNVVPSCIKEARKSLTIPWSKVSDTFLIIQSS